MGTTISTCNCKSEFQDSKYGKYNRIFNLDQSGTKGTCTVCGSKKQISSRPIEKAK